MKLLVFFNYVFFLLLGGGQYFYANTLHNSTAYSSVQNFASSKQAKFINPDQGSTIIEDTDIDIEEEYITTDDFKGGIDNKFFIGKYSLLNTMYSNNCRQFVLNYCDNRFKIYSLLRLNSGPIYIIQRVLRI